MGYKDKGIRKSEFVTKTPITLNDSNVSQIYEFFLNFYLFQRFSQFFFTVNRNQAFFSVKIQVLIPPLLQKGKIEKMSMKSVLIN